MPDRVPQLWIGVAQDGKQTGLGAPLLVSDADVLPGDTGYYTVGSGAVIGISPSVGQIELVSLGSPIFFRVGTTLSGTLAAPTVDTPNGAPHVIPAGGAYRFYVSGATQIQVVSASPFTLARWTVQP